MVRKTLSVFDTVLDRIFSAAGAAALSQFPEFVQQYIQRLGGHVDEALRQVRQIEMAAHGSGKSVAEYVQKFLTSQDVDIHRQGAVLQATLERARELRNALEAVQNASVIEKPFIFISHLRIPVAKATLENFRPAVPLTLENLLYAFVGMFLGLMVYHIILKSPLRLLAGKRRAPASR